MSLKIIKHPFSNQVSKLVKVTSYKSVIAFVNMSTNKISMTKEMFHFKMLRLAYACFINFKCKSCTSIQNPYTVSS